MNGHPGEIVFEELSKEFGRRPTVVRAVSDLSVTIRPGRVTGFLGPNGAGKTTTLRCLLGLVRPTAGRALIGGRPYERLVDPIRTVGATLEATGFYPGRRAHDHLRAVALAGGVPASRVAEVLRLTGLEEVGSRRVGQFSLGMRQRLSLATALLGDPTILVLDEPANGLDPQGIAWLRSFLRRLADEGRTVLISSHVLAEVQQTVDDVVIIRSGELVRHESLAELVAREAQAHTHVVTPNPEGLSGAAREWATNRGVPVEVTAVGDSTLRITGMSPAEVGSIAYRNGMELHELTLRHRDLEQVFLDLTRSPTQPEAASSADSAWAPPTGSPVAPSAAERWDPSATPPGTGSQPTAPGPGTAAGPWPADRHDEQAG